MVEFGQVCEGVSNCCWEIPYVLSCVLINTETVASICKHLWPQFDRLNEHFNFFKSSIKRSKIRGLVEHQWQYVFVTDVLFNGLSIYFLWASWISALVAFWSVYLIYLKIDPSIVPFIDIAVPVTLEVDFIVGVVNTLSYSLNTSVEQEITIFLLKLWIGKTVFVTIFHWIVFHYILGCTVFVEHGLGEHKFLSKILVQFCNRNAHQIWSRCLKQEGVHLF